ncbi:DUF5685 family protein [Ligaoa zhengdingensis]|uniref:DUF5685 family protein n=1 Tax=Ligaoa zhengdingensis TaxID=2763658 RepID=UPI0031BB59FC
MFGYVKPYKPQMKICEYDTYKAVYCGLCKQLGHSYGFAARFTLSYDFAFLSILSMALQANGPEFCRERCIAHPLKKSFCCSLNDSSRFAACTAMIMLYYKLEDNYRDSGPGGKALMLLARPFAAAARNKARREYPRVDELVAEMMRRQYALEDVRCPSIDEAAEPTARCLSELCSLLSQDETEQRILQRFGYLLGRWIYLIDALDDLEDDIKTGSYNAFVINEHLTVQSDLAPIRGAAVASLNQTAAELAKAYELFELRRYKTILDNVVYLGLKNTLNQVEEKRRNPHDRSL